MFTRKDYLNGVCSFSDYYGEVLEESHVYLPPSLIERARRSTDQKNFNDIPLHVWDGLPTPLNAGKAFRARGDYPTPAGYLCLHKEAMLRHLAAHK